MLAAVHFVLGTHKDVVKAMNNIISADECMIHNRKLVLQTGAYITIWPRHVLLTDIHMKPVISCSHYMLMT